MLDKKIKLSASMSCADFRNLEKEINLLVRAKIDVLHFDICDGYFAPTFLFSPIIIKALRSVTEIRFDAHLYCEYPSRYIKELACSGVDTLIVHTESKENYKNVIKKIIDLGLKAGMAILPNTTVSMDIVDILPNVSLVITNTVGPAYSGQIFNPKGLINMQKINEVIRNGKYKNIEIGADGGVNMGNIEEIIASGANLLVLGSTGIFFNDKDYIKKVNSIKSKIKDILNK